MFYRKLLLTGAICVATVPAGAQQPLSLSMRDGSVTLRARAVSVSQILREWARVGDVRIVNSEKVPAHALTLDLQGVSEREALGVILRGVSGYVLAARPAGAQGAAVFDRIVILPTSASPVTPPPPVAGARPAAAQLPQARPGVPGSPIAFGDGQDDDDQGDGSDVRRPLPTRAAASVVPDAQRDAPPPGGTTGLSAPQAAIPASPQPRQPTGSSTPPGATTPSTAGQRVPTSGPFANGPAGSTRPGSVSPAAANPTPQAAPPMPTRHQPVPAVPPAAGTAPSS